MEDIRLLGRYIQGSGNSGKIWLLLAWIHALASIDHGTAILEIILGHTSQWLAGGGGGKQEGMPVGAYWNAPTRSGACKRPG